MRLFKKINLKSEDNSDFNKLLNRTMELIDDDSLPEYEARDILNDYLSSMNKYYIDRVRNKMINDAISMAKKIRMSPDKVIQFSKEEFDFIRSFNNIYKERIFFLLFCLYKYYDGRFVIRKSTIESAAFVPKNFFNSTDYIKEEKDNLFCAKIDKSFYIYPSEYIKSLYNENNICLVITNYENVVYYYDSYYYPEKYIYCNKCGKIDKKNSGSQKYCKRCSEECKLERYRKYNASRPKSNKIFTTNTN